MSDAPVQPTRRDFLKTASAATLAALAAGYPRALRAQEPEQLTPTADTLILLWMAGGMAHTETFDPKRYTPFEPGVESERRAQHVPGDRHGGRQHQDSRRGWSSIAKVMDRGTLIRSLHGRRPRVHPALAASVPLAHRLRAAADRRRAAPRRRGSRARSARANPAIPAFINIGQRFDVGEGEELKAFTTAGFLGSEYGPFNIPFPERGRRQPCARRRDDARAVRGPRQVLSSSCSRRARSASTAATISRSRCSARWTTRTACSARPRRRRSISRSSRENVRSTCPGYDPGKRSTREGSLRRATTRQMVGRFGLGCLLARRLDGSRRAVHRSHHRVHPVPQLGHARERPHAARRHEAGRSTRPIAQLVLDLEERGLLDRTLIVLASEFSRDMMIEGKPDNGVEGPGRRAAEIDQRAEALRHAPPLHRRRQRAAVRRRHEARLPPRRDRRRAAVQDDQGPGRASTTCTPRSTAPWASRRKLAFDVEKRPFYVTSDGKGQVIGSLFA